MEEEMNQGSGVILLPNRLKGKDDIMYRRYELRMKKWFSAFQCVVVPLYCYGELTVQSTQGLVHLPSIEWTRTAIYSLSVAVICLVFYKLYTKMKTHHRYEFETNQRSMMHSFRCMLAVLVLTIVYN
jgi:hypothetical protein